MLNRIKIWVYVLVVVGVGAWAIRGQSAAGSARAVANVDARLTAAAGQLDVGLKLIESRAASVAGLAALDRGLIEALAARPTPTKEPKAAKGKAKAKKASSADPEAERREEEALERAVESAARDAVERAEKALGFELPALSFWAAADKGGIAKKLAAGSEGSQKEAVAFLASASKGQPRRGFARINDGLWYGVGIPMAGGGALVLFVALDEGWARSLQASAGVDVTLSAGLPKAVTTLAPADAKAIASAALARAGTPVDAGKLAKVAAGFDLPFKVAPLPLLFGAAPTARALAVGLTGVKDGYAVLSASMAPGLGPVVHGEWKGLALLVGALFLGLFVGLLVHGEAPSQVPDELLQAAARIERGDFGARVPTMAGKYGTVAGALNRAADAASHVAAAVESPDGTAQFFGRAPTHPDAPASPASNPTPAPIAVPLAAQGDQRAFSTTQRMDGSAMFGSTFAPPEPEPEPAASPEPLSESQEEERHWEATFDEFLRVRDECGEGSDGLTFDRFRLKLEKNKDTLVQKYGCRTVRFQVYVKDGKAALKATPVK